MTRDEALGKVRIAATTEKYSDTASIIVDGLVSLGMLKLDEPKKSPAEIIGERFWNLRLPVHQYTSGTLGRCAVEALHGAGFSIIETGNANAACADHSTIWGGAVGTNAAVHEVAKK